MLRLATLALAFVLGTMAPANAREACEGLGVEAYIGQVPYFGGQIKRVQTADTGAITFEHPDDRRIRAAFRLQAVPAEVPVTRQDYLKELRQSLVRESRRAPPGSEVTFGVFPYDPISWTMRTRVKDGDDVTANGSLTVRLAPTCHLVANWSVLEQPILGARIAELASAIDALRLKAAGRSEPSGFLPDNNVPTGWKALLFGFAIPVMASLALMYGLKGMLLLKRPGSIPRAVAAGSAALAAGVIYAQVPDYLIGFEDSRYLDNAGLLLFLVGLLVPAAALGNQKAVLSAFCVCACSGLALAIGAILGWAPDPKTNLVLGVVLVLATVAGLRGWWGQGSRRKGPAASMARAA